ncbi:MAG: murein peptide amidase A [Calditrichaeota bacterium]|nr:murein peptide amidase A [Calditrichota bacterium]
MHVNFKGFYFIVLILLIILFYKVFLPYYRHLKLHSQTKELYNNLTKSNIPWKIIGYSEKERPIYALEVGAGEDTVMIMGAFHGDEQVGFHLVVQLAETLYKAPEQIHSLAVLIPVVNPDGLLSRKRTNANGVDINRNFPTGDWSPVYTKKKYYPGIRPSSESETQTVLQLIDKYKPDRIISIHSDLRMNNYNGPARRLAELMSKFNGYPVTGDVGYPTPGSFGTYAGYELKIPLITLELPDVPPEKAWQQNYRALIEAINFKE